MCVIDLGTNEKKAQQKHEERAKKHNRKQSSTGAPQDFWTGNQNDDEEDQNQDEDVTPNRENITTQQTFGQPEATPEIQAQDNYEEQEQGQRQPENDYMDEDALKKHKERQEKVHEKKGTLVTPEEFLDKQDVSDGNENDDKLNKRRGSQQLDEETQANIKSQQSADNGQAAAAVPDYANTEEAKRVREERAKKARKESVAVPKNFLSTEDQNSEDDESVQKRRQHQRKQSLMKAVGQKGHLSDEDTEKTQHVDHEARRKVLLYFCCMLFDKNARPKTKDAEVIQESLSYPAVLLTAAQQEVKALKEKLGAAEEEKRLIEAQKKMIEEQKKLAEEQTKMTEEQKRVIEEQLQNTKKEAQQLENKLGQQLEKQIEEKFQKATNGLIASNKKEVEQMTFRIDELTKQLNNVSNSKMNLIQCTNTEINRLKLTFFKKIQYVYMYIRVINTLLQSEKCKEITRLLLDDTTKE
ncbi:virulent strain associated lipoprotein [Reticulomyxa filosa]|uniref:Virulent strain associated lipoprotein n=1 Tax=Reticulomyxa filosa TaxID=46433 RepID=X6NX19_RETFI|nr:virulent strain associated lipoprotein [Reticulomyxa filosa]|eukprot:ETO30546.1 virulent strain associated lipoprotein [Reticulomyxa filosa]